MQLILVSVVVLFALTACGGGGVGSATTVVVEDPVVYALGRQFRGSAACVGPVCSVTILGETSEIDVRDLDQAGPRSQLGPSSLRNGMRLARGTATSEDDGVLVEFNTWAGWGEYQAFMPGTGVALAEGSRIDFAFPVSFGEGTATNPVSGSATWRGAMLGVQYGLTRFGADVVGDASMNVDFADGDLDLAFTNIQEQGTGRPLQSILWADVPMRNGEFRGPGLEGRFYGPAHEEAGGVFDRNQIVGAFGVSR